MSFLFVADTALQVAHRYDCEHARSIRRRNFVTLLHPDGYRECAWCLGGGREKERDAAIERGDAT